MPDTKHAAQLLLIVERDLDGMRSVLPLSTFPIEIFGFWAQQAVEKALKAWLAFRDIQYPLIHDLDKLINLLEQSGEEIEPWIRSLAFLTPFAVQFRYEPVPPDEFNLDRESLIVEIELLAALVKGRILHG